MHTTIAAGRLCEKPEGLRTLRLATMEVPMPKKMANLPREEFTAKFLARMPIHLARTFTSEQLEAIRKAFGSRFASSHAFEFKRLLRLPWGRFYFVILMGRDRRSVAPLADRLSRIPTGYEEGALADAMAADANNVKVPAASMASR